MATIIVSHVNLNGKLSRTSKQESKTHGILAHRRVAENQKIRTC